MSTSSLKIPQLYRAILKAAARFPSKKRAALVEDIKAEFHANKRLTDPKEVDRLRGLARESLEQLHSYIDLAGDGTELYLKGPCQS
mmetsp:Transcript_1184/g.2808  ORF Transcript_1184/g.2808 Transcript_1184/m.2808 type:complete len:86 (-) Transcript_1184:253-510(-)|eukprot:CAMPEP_0177593892 /NCGR_PEP_ID=MMETSP0419_2-20121207/9456_1 /TAXON_ID=582737 /ORGANISM="Tetraselmis sp., Strain GSL018" /LENGTH=85 /DNA_ID=CAMNT_0019085097 /DNA_START=369 /DNA_END=626 /DNA_ORIENTATION=+